MIEEARRPQAIRSSFLDASPTAHARNSVDTALAPRNITPARPPGALRLRPGVSFAIRNL
jgi:hypothetical protein